MKQRGTQDEAIRKALELMFHERIEWRERKRKEKDMTESLEDRILDMQICSKVLREGCEPVQVIIPEPSTIAEEVRAIKAENAELKAKLHDLAIVCQDAMENNEDLEKTIGKLREKIKTLQAETKE